MSTHPRDFRTLVHELTLIVGVTATADLPEESIRIDTPLEETPGHRLAGPSPALVPILRAGLGMVSGLHALMPHALVGHIGVNRDEDTLKPETYYTKLPDQLGRRTVFLLDPMLATGGSILAAIRVLKQAGAKKIRIVSLVVAPEGIAAVAEAYPDVPIFCAVQDRKLNRSGYILPGLGDAGDRQFGT